MDSLEDTGSDISCVGDPSAFLIPQGYVRIPSPHPLKEMYENGT